MRAADTLFPLAEGALGAYAAFVPDGGSSHRSTTTHALPDGEVTVVIDATGRGIHGYLHYLVTSAVSYTQVADVDVGRASLLAALLLGLGIGLVAVGHPVPSVPLFGAGGMVAAHVVGYSLSARGIPVSVTRQPDPVDRYG